MIPPQRPNPIESPAAACLALLLLLAACVTTETRLPPDFGPRPVTVVDRWEVREAGSLVGRLALLNIDDRGRPEVLYKVEHADGQHAGWIDLDGRAWREEPFRKGLVLVGMATMAEDLRVLLELREVPELCKLEEHPSDLAAR